MSFWKWTHTQLHTHKIINLPSLFIFFVGYAVRDVWGVLQRVERQKPVHGCPWNELFPRREIHQRKYRFINQDIYTHNCIYIYINVYIHNYMCVYVYIICWLICFWGTIGNLMGRVLSTVNFIGIEAFLLEPGIPWESFGMGCVTASRSKSFATTTGFWHCSIFNQRGKATNGDTQARAGGGCMIPPGVLCWESDPSQKFGFTHHCLVVIGTWLVFFP